MRFRDLLLIAHLAPAVFADVQFTSPAAGSSVDIGSIKMAWKDSGVAPAVADLTSYQIQLMVGGDTDTDSTALTVLVAQGAFASGNMNEATILATLAGPTKNGFYLKMTSTAKVGGTVINYSDRFNIPGMTGTTPPTSVAGAAAISGTDGPPTVNQIAAAAPAAGAAGAPGAGNPLYSVAYALQTGLTKYAPMQKVPPTKISMKNYTPMYPTSAFNVATTWLPRPTVQTTMTEVQTFSVQPIENPAAAQTNPTNPMQKYLARWKD